MIKLKDGQQVRIHLPNMETEGLLKHECCGCGLMHNLYVGRIGQEVTLVFVRTATTTSKATKKTHKNKK